MQNKSNKKNSYFRKGGKCRITFIFLKKGKKQTNIVNKNVPYLHPTLFPFFCRMPIELDNFESFLFCMCLGSFTLPQRMSTAKWQNIAGYKNSLNRTTSCFEAHLVYKQMHTQTPDFLISNAR